MNYDYDQRTCELRLSRPRVIYQSLIENAKVIHLDNGWDWSTQEWFYSSVLKQGPLSTSDFDMMGISFYPVSSQSSYNMSYPRSAINIFFSSSKTSGRIRSCLNGMKISILTLLSIYQWLKRNSGEPQD